MFHGLSEVKLFCAIDLNNQEKNYPVKGKNMNPCCTFITFPSILLSMELLLADTDH